MSFTTTLNLGGLREALRVRAGLPEKGPIGKDRADKALNYSVRKFQNELPEAFQREEHRIRLQPAYSITVDVHPTDARIVRVEHSSSTILGNDGTLWARWIDITDATGVVHRRRVRSTFRQLVTTGWPTNNTTYDMILLDRMLPVLAVTSGLAAKLFTLEYPLPPDWKDVTDVWRLDAGTPTKLTGLFAEELERVRMSGDWLQEGVPEAYARGDYFQMRTPHDTPAVAKAAGGLANLTWGKDSSGVSHASAGTSPYYEAAGTFQYCYCLVWGRLKTPGGVPNTFGFEPDYGIDRQMPFYISAPSATTAEVTTTWGSGAIVISSVDQDVQEVYQGSHGTQLDFADGNSGLEKWWFRARTAVDSTAGPITNDIEADGEFYFWGFTSPSGQVFDRGQSPVITSFPLKEFTGHQSLRFDKLPNSSIIDVAVRGRRRQDLLKDDADVVRCPSDCLDAIVFLTLSVLAGERDGNMGRMKEYRGLYQEELKMLRKQYAMPGHRPTPAGSIADGGSVFNFPLPVKEDTG